MNIFSWKLEIRKVSFAAGLLKPAILVSILAIAACSPGASTSTPTPEGLWSEPITPGVLIQIDASNSQPKAGDVVTLDINLQAREDVPNATVTSILPASILAQGKPLLWTGDLRNQQTKRFSLEVLIAEWPPEEPVTIEVTNGIVTYWANWPEVGTGPTSSGLKQTSLSVDSTPSYAHLNSGSDFYGESISPTVEIELEVSDANPKPGDTVRFTARLNPSRDLQQISGRFDLPPAFSVESGELEWEGDLARGRASLVQLVATANDLPQGDARFSLDLGAGETNFGSYSFPSEGRALPPNILFPVFAEGDHLLDGQAANDKPSDQKGSDSGDTQPIDITVSEESIGDGLITLGFDLFANRRVRDGLFEITLPESVEIIEGSLE